MKTIIRLIFIFLSNLLALWMAFYFVEGFKITPNVRSFVTVAAIFSLIIIFIRPIIKAILSPIIILTLGLGIIIVNALTLYLLDFLSVDITITGLMPLIYATLIISLVGIFTHFFRKKTEQK